MSAILQKIKPLIVPSVGRHSATVICLHGSGDDGANFWEWIKSETEESFVPPHVRLIIPTAPFRAYSAAMGQPSRVWFDRLQISPYVAEDEATAQESCDTMRQLVEAEIEAGISENKIMIGGFSMGGSLALSYGLRCGLNLAGIFALSSFLSENSTVFEDLKEDDTPRPPLFQAHGQMDQLVLYEWGHNTHQKLLSLGVKGEFHTFPNLFHEIRKSELKLLKNWIRDKLPEK